MYDQMADLVAANAVMLTMDTACQEEHIRRSHEEMVQLCRPEPD
jgi:hypothetical protein